MATIFILIAIIGVCALLTVLVVKGAQKFKTMKPINFKFPKITIPKINFPKIKIPNFLGRKPKTSLTILNSGVTPYENIFQENLEIEYENGEYRRTTKKPNNNNSGFSMPKNVWVMTVGLVLIGFVVFYFMKKWKR